ncbi:hypothetical protein GGS20DRAFT_583184 [Poronia punctata]|nr:hypothetical protein GGS20DRAFT_583184 [Poronia punctata]
MGQMLSRPSFAREPNWRQRLVDSDIHIWFNLTHGAFVYVDEGTMQVITCDLTPPDEEDEDSESLPEEDHRLFIDEVRVMLREIRIRLEMEISDDSSDHDEDDDDEEDGDDDDDGEDGEDAEEGGDGDEEGDGEAGPGEDADNDEDSGDAGEEDDHHEQDDDPGDSDRNNGEPDMETIWGSATGEHRDEHEDHDVEEAAGSTVAHEMKIKGKGKSPAIDNESGNEYKKTESDDEDHSDDEDDIHVGMKTGNVNDIAGPSGSNAPVAMTNTDNQTAGPRRKYRKRKPRVK